MKNSREKKEKNEAVYTKGHHQEWLNQVQAKRNVKIPTEIINRIKKELDGTLVTVESIRKVLKTQQLVKYWDCVYSIHYELTGTNPIENVKNGK